MVRPELHLPPSFLAWLAPYLTAFSRRSRPTTAALAVGALLAVGPRTVTNPIRDARRLRRRRATERGSEGDASAELRFGYGTLAPDTREHCAFKLTAKRVRGRGRARAGRDPVSLDGFPD